MPRYTPLAAALLAALSSFAFAEDAVPASNSSQTPSAPTTLPTVTVTGARDYRPQTSTVGGKTEQAIRDIPQTVNVVNKELMQAQGATSLADALRNVPGITIGGAEGGQIGNNINLRGFTARTDIYIDGFRDRGQYYRDVFDLEQIEVLQGPSSMLFGRGSTGGVINQSTKKAQLRNFNEVAATVGTSGRVRSTLDSNTKLSETSAFRVNVFGQDLKTTRDNMSNKDFGIAPTLTIGINQPTEITLSALIQHNRDMPDYGVQSLNGSPITASRNAFYGLSTDRTDQDVEMVNGTIKHSFNDHIQLRNQTQINRYRTNALETAPRALSTTTTAGGVITPPTFGNYNPNQLYVELQSHDRTIVDNSFDNQTDLISHFSSGSIKHELITGLELSHDTYKNQAYSRTGAGLPNGMVGFTSLEDPSYSVLPAVTKTTGNLAQSSANSIGYYANDTVSITDQWKIVAGLRHDRYDAKLSNSTSTPNLVYQTTNFTSKRAGVIYQPTTEQSYYASYGTSFNPILEQLTITNGTQNLPPTNTRSYEVGTKWDVLNNRLSLTGAVFDELQKNVYTAFNGEYQASGNWKIKGYSLSAVGRPIRNLQLSAGFMHLDPRIVDTVDGTAGSIPANTPKNTATLWASYELTPVWEVGGGPSYMSQRYVANSGISAAAPQGNIDRVSAAGYTRWDGTVAYHQRQYEVRFNFFNMFNKSYYDALIPSDGGRSVPGIGRTALLTGTYRF